MNNFLSKRKDVKFKIQKFDESMLPQAINCLSYGMKVFKYSKKGAKKHLRLFYLLDEDYRFLQWISPNKSFTKSRINLSEIKDLSHEVLWKIKSKNTQHFLKIQTTSIEIVLEFFSETDRDSFQYGIQYFTVQSAHHEFLEKRQDQVKHLANILFLNADKDGNKQLSLDETKRLLQELHISVNKKYLKKLFETYDVNQNGQIDQSEFISIIRDISKKEELMAVFQKYCPEYIQNSRDQDSLMTIAQYQEFMKEEQKQTMSTSEIAELFKTTTNQVFVKSNNSKIQNILKISFYQFSNFLFSYDNCIFDPLLEENYQDMDRPLSDFYINSSHNTYLMANQLTGDSSCQAYINALLNGCRCVEIDCWDGEKGEPIVYHGHTLTSKILFKNVIETIDQYAFTMSVYPVILSFENHCSLEQTKRMAYYVKSIFKEKLFLIPKDYDKFEYYPSPNQLKCKIIVKSKGTVEKAVNENSQLGFVSESDEDQDEDVGSQTDLQILNNLNKIIPDYSNHSQFMQNQVSGKKKLIFNQKSFQEQQEILQKNSKNVQQQVSLRDNSSEAKPQLSLLPRLFTEDIVGLGDTKGIMKVQSKEDAQSDFHDVKKEGVTQTRVSFQGGILDDIKMIENITEENEPLMKEQFAQKQARSSKFSIPAQPTLGDWSSMNNSNILEDPAQEVISKKEETSFHYQPELIEKIGRTSSETNAAVKQLSKGFNLQLKNQGTEELPTGDVSLPVSGVKSKKKIKECKEFLEITTLFGCHLTISEKERQCWYISSISEVKYHKLLHKYPTKLIDIFKKSFVRLYPSGVRVDSSNYDPIKPFLSGAQIVALNFQTNDIPMLLNQSKFQENGGVHSGYLLKPYFMLHDAEKKLVPNLLTKIVKTIKIQIISGQQLRPENYESDTFDVVDPYVQIFIRGTDFDESNNRPQLTSTISDNGFHPIWNSETFEFNFACPELAMMVFRIMDSDVGTDTQLGFYATPIDAMRPGYRVVPLRYKSGLQFAEHSYVLVKIQIEEKIQRYNSSCNSSSSQ